MSEFTLNETLEMQRRLQEKYKDVWEPIVPENGKNKVLWMVSEIGEVIDLIKKQGHERVCQDPALRKQLVEELADVLMFYNDILLCFDISSEELKQIYIEKFEKNMMRW